MKKGLFTLVCLYSFASLASNYQFTETRNKFKEARPLSMSEFFQYVEENQDISCVNFNEDGGSDLLENTFKLKTITNDKTGETIVTNIGGDYRFKIELNDRDGEVIGSEGPKGEFSPVRMYKTIRKSGNRLYVEWSHKPYTVENYFGTYRYGYNSPASITLPGLTSRVYSSCK